MFAVNEAMLIVASLLTTMLGELWPASEEFAATDSDVRLLLITASIAHFVAFVLLLAATVTASAGLGAVSIVGRDGSTAKLLYIVKVLAVTTFLFMAGVATMMVFVALDVYERMAAFGIWAAYGCLIFFGAMYLVIMILVLPLLIHVLPVGAWHAPHWYKLTFWYAFLYFKSEINRGAHLEVARLKQLARQRGLRIRRDALPEQGRVSSSRERKPKQPGLVLQKRRPASPRVAATGGTDFTL